MEIITHRTNNISVEQDKHARTKQHRKQRTTYNAYAMTASVVHCDHPVFAVRSRTRSFDVRETNSTRKNNCFVRFPTALPLLNSKS